MLIGVALTDANGIADGPIGSKQVLVLSMKTAAHTQRN
jgi:hypothetical protein